MDTDPSDSWGPGTKTRGERVSEGRNRVGEGRRGWRGEEEGAGEECWRGEDREGLDRFRVNECKVKNDKVRMKYLHYFTNISRQIDIENKEIVGQTDRKKDRELERDK